MVLISIVTPCKNEEAVIEHAYLAVKSIFSTLNHYSYEHIFIDNASTDNTVSILKTLAKTDKNIKLIINSRDFGHLRSPYYAMLNTNGTAVIPILADLQTPPSIIPDLIKQWENGYKMVLAIRQKSQENPIIYFFRTLYYRFINMISETTQIPQFIGFGLYDKSIIDILKEFDDPYPYFRGLIQQIGFKKAIVNYTQPNREKGKTKNNLFTLYDLIILGIVSQSKRPLRMIGIVGCTSFFMTSLLLVLYMVFQLFTLKTLQLTHTFLGYILLFLISVIFLFLGIMSEYIYAVLIQVKKQPLVIEQERINFD